MLRSVIGRAKDVASRALVAGMSVVALVSTTDVVASKGVRPPTRDDLATVWVGGGGESLEFFRLELDAAGTGVLTVQYLPGGSASAYRVLRTSLAGYTIALELTPTEGGAQPLQVRGEATPVLLELDVSARAPDWTRRVRLQRYDQLLERIKAVTEKAAAYTNTNR